MIQRRSFLIAALALPASRFAAAQAYPIRPIRVIVPYAAGGTDQFLRPLLPALQAALGQPMVIENVGGGGGMIGANMVRTSQPDGHTLLFSAAPVLTLAPKLSKATYSAADFAAVCNVIGIPFVFAVKSESPHRTLRDLIAAARAKPGALSFGSAGLGTSTHLTGEAFAARIDAKLLHVPFQGIVPAVTSLIGGNIDFVVGAPSVVMPQVRGGKLRALAVSSPERFEAAPDVPTLREQEVDIAEITRYGLFAPAGTPAAVLEALSAAIGRAVRAPEYIAGMRAAFNGIAFMGPQAYREALAAEDKYYTRMVGILDLKESK